MSCFTFNDEKYVFLAVPSSSTTQRQTTLNSIYHNEKNSGGPFIGGGSDLCLYRDYTNPSYSNLLFSIDLSIGNPSLNDKLFRIVLGANVTNSSEAYWKRSLSQSSQWNNKLSFYDNAIALDDTIAARFKKEINPEHVSYYFAEINLKDSSFSIGTQVGSTTNYLQKTQISNPRFGNLQFSFFENTHRSTQLSAKYNNEVLNYVLENVASSNGTFGIYHQLSGVSGERIKNLKVGTRSLNDPFSFCEPEKKHYTIGFTGVYGYTDPIISIDYLQKLINKINEIYSIFNIYFTIEYLQHIPPDERTSQNLFDYVGSSADFNYAITRSSTPCCCSIKAIGCANYPGLTCKGTGWMIVYDNIPYDATLLAHELGHNFGATHISTGKIMNPGIEQPVYTFDPANISQINQGINGPCFNKATIVPAVEPYVKPIPPEAPEPPTNSDPKPPSNNFTIIESAGSVTLAYDSNNNIRVNGGPPVTWRGIRVVYDSGIWKFMAAETINGVNTILLRHVSGNIWHWVMNESWTENTSGYGWYAPGTENFKNSERLFGVDVDGDGYPSSVASLLFTTNLPETIFLNDGEILNLEVKAVGFDSNNKPVPFPVTPNTYKWYTTSTTSNSLDFVWIRILRRPGTDETIFSTPNWQRPERSYTEYKCVVTTNDIELESNVVKVYRKPPSLSLTINSYKYVFVYPSTLQPFYLKNLPSEIKSKIASIYGITEGQQFLNPDIVFDPKYAYTDGVFLPGKAYVINSIKNIEPWYKRGTTRALLPYVMDFSTFYSPEGVTGPALQVEDGEIPTYNVDSSWNATINENAQAVLIDKQIFIPISEINNIDKINKIYTYIDDKIYLYQKNYEFSNLSILKPDSVYVIEKDVDEPVELQYVI